VLCTGMLVPPATALLARTGSRSGLSYRAVPVAGTTVFVDERHASTVAEVVAFARSHARDEIAFFPFLQAFYVLTGHRPPVSHSLLLPGFDSDAEVDTVSRELLGRPVRWLVYAPMPLANLAPNLPGAADRARGKPWRFEQFLRRHYTPRARLGYVLSLRRVTLYELRR